MIAIGSSFDDLGSLEGGVGEIWRLATTGVGRVACELEVLLLESIGRDRIWKFSGVDFRASRAALRVQGYGCLPCGFEIRLVLDIWCWLVVEHIGFSVGELGPL